MSRWLILRIAETAFAQSFRSILWDYQRYGTVPPGAGMIRVALYAVSHGLLTTTLNLYSNLNNLLGLR